MTRYFIYLWLILPLWGCGRFGYRVPIDASSTKKDGSTTGDGTGFDTSQYNIVFVTSMQVKPGELGSIGAGDAVCNERAQAAGLKGTYVAWLSSSLIDAKDRLGGARGWVRVDGKPVADQITDLTSGVIWYPIVIDELGFSYASGSSDWVATGTLEDGTRHPLNNCEDWTSTVNIYKAQSGRMVSTYIQWTNDNAAACSSLAHLYCFGIDKSNALTITPVSGPRAFVSTSWNIGAGLASADMRCQNDATAAGLAGTFQAFLATTTTTAASRFASDGAVWVGGDGLPIAASRTAMFADNFDRPVHMTAAGARALVNVWSGSMLPSSVGSASDTCQNWSSNSASTFGVFALSADAGDRAFGSAVIACSTVSRVMCLQTP